MRKIAQLVPCPDCGALVPDTDGPTHRSIGGSPGCWSIFNAVGMRHYDDIARGAVHQDVVDAYMAQHPGTPAPQAIQSVNVHLVSLCLALEHGYDPPQRIAALQAATAWKREYAWLDPPKPPWPLTIRDVYDAPDRATQIERTRAWALSVWEAWSSHHAAIRGWATKVRGV